MNGLDKRANVASTGELRVALYENARLKAELKKITAELDEATGVGPLRKARGTLLSCESQLHEALDDFLTKPDRASQQFIAESAIEYRQAWAAMEAAEAAQVTK